MPIRGSSSDIEFGIRITADNQVFVDGVRASSDEVKKLGEGLKQVSKDAEGTTRSQESLTGAVFKGNVAMEAMRLAGDALVATFRTMVEEARANELAQIRTETVLRATGGAAQRTAAQIDALSQSMARSTFFDNNEIKNAAAQLATFGDIAGEAFDRTLKAGANLAALFGGDLASRTMQVAKALTEPATSLSSLERVIGKLEPALRKQIQQFAEMGNVAGAQKLILDELDKRTGNVAETIKTGMVGALDDLTKSWRDLLGEIGKGGGEDGLGVKFLKSVAEQLRGLKNFIETGDWYVRYIAIFNPTLASMIGNQMAQERGQNAASGTIKPAAGSTFSLEDQDARAIAVAIANAKKYAAERKKILEDWLAAELKGREILEDADRRGAQAQLDLDRKTAEESDRILKDRLAAELKAQEIEDQARQLGAERQLQWDREEAARWAGFIGGIEGAFRAMWDAFAEGGANAAEVARSMLKRILFDWLYQAFARPIVLNIVAAGAGMLGMSGLANAATGTAGNLGGSLLGTSLTSMLGSEGLAGTIGSWIGGSFGAGMMGTQLAGGAGLLGSAGSMLATAMPWLLPIAAITAFSGLFGKGGGPKGGGSFFGNYSGAGSFLGNIPVPGTDNGRFYTPNDADSVLAQLGGTTAQGYFAALQRFGGSSGGPVSFGLGYDTDPRGSASNRISSSVVIGGRQVFGSTARDIGRDESQIGPQLQLEASRALLAALQASELPASIAAIFKTVDAASATQEEIDKVLKLAEAFQGLTDTLKAIDLDTILGDASKGPVERFREQGEALLELAGNTTMSTDSLNQLTAATAAYRESAVELVLAFESAKQSIDAMFAETRRNIQMAGLDDQGKYNFYQDEANRLFAQIQTATSPEEIERLSALINRDINAAFGLLSPEQQRAMQQDFLNRLDATNRTIQERLRALQEQAVKDTNEALDKISKMMEKLAADQQAAATNQVSAANTQLAAASKPLRVDVNVSDSRVNVALVNEGG